MKWKVLGAVVLVGLVVLLLTEGVIIPKQLQPDAVPVRFVGYAGGGEGSEPAGAEFEIENRTRSRVVVWETVELVWPAGSGRTAGQATVERTLIEPGMTGSVLVEFAGERPERVAFSIAKFGRRQEREFAGGGEVAGTVSYSEPMPAPGAGVVAVEGGAP